ncbi:MAG TPA: DUF3108 domain-containing protein [Ignavibacteria bacterium]|nr:DUF3108 domain-containing protein [Ignavibacteria bacterium]
MRIKIILAVLSLFIYAGAVQAQGDTTNTPVTFRTIQQNAFTAGEKLNFEINYGFITAGSAVMEISPSYQTMNGREVYDISVRIKSSSSFEWVYKVEDLYKCYLDRQGLFPWRFEQHIREGNFKKDFEAIFDHENGKVKAYTGETEPKKFEGEYDIPMYVHDILSAFYFARTLDYSGMSSGQTVQLQNFYNDKVHPLNVKYHGRETVDVPAGEFKCIKIEPMVVEGGLFKSEGNLIVWLTDDERKMPVMVKTKVLVGSMDVELTSYSGLAGPLNSKID